MACNTCKKKTEDCGCKATSITIDSICNPIDCGSEECSESFAAQCILYTGDDIICDTTTVVTSGDSVAQSLANIVQFFCDRNDPTINEDILCGIDVVVTAGTSLLDALVDLNNYFCSAIDTLTLFASTNSNRIGTVDPFNPLCTDYAHTITYLDSLGGTIATTNFNTRTCEPLFIEDEGVLLPARDTLNFTGGGVTATDTGTKIEVNVPTPTTYGLFAQTANSTPIIGTLTEETLIGAGLGSLTVPANTFVVGDSFHAKLFGHITAVNSNATVRVKFNTVTVLTLPFSLPNITDLHWSLDIYFTIRSLGALGSVLTGIQFQHEEDAADKFSGHAFTDLITIDTTSNNTLDITMQFDNTNDSIYSELFTLTKTY